MAVLATLGGIFIVIISTIIKGFVLVKLWGWFIIPVFNAPVLSVPYAIGLSLLVNYITPTEESKEEDEELASKFLKLGAKAVIAPLIVLLFGWVVVQFV